jgi:hypothetical protein
MMAGHEMSLLFRDGKEEARSEIDQHSAYLSLAFASYTRSREQESARAVAGERSDVQTYNNL